MLYIGIIGSRRRDSDGDFYEVQRAFNTIYIPGETTIVSGGCPTGGDRFAEILIRLCGTPEIIHRPNKAAYPELQQPLRSTKQNYERNTLVARDSRDFLIACVAPDRRGGTEDTIRKWRKFYPDKEPILV